MRKTNRPKPKANPNGGEVMQLMTAALQAADEMGIDSVAIVCEVLEAEGFPTGPKSKENHS
jgi:hypothetical protein